MKHIILFLIQIIAFIAFLDSRRISGGGEAVRGDFPWHVKLEPLIGNARRLCGGALIKYNWVLTAGQCIYNARDAIVRLGVSNRLEGPESAIFWITNREHIMVHEDYNEDPENSRFENDIGLIYIQAATEAILNDYYVDYVTLPEDRNLNVEGFVGYVSGFGFYQDGDDALQSMKLRYTNMSIYSNDFCEQYFGNTVFTDGHFCTSTIYGSTCIGDEGGPFVTVIDAEVYVIGIASMQLQKCTAGDPSIFTNLTPYRNWIDDKVNDPNVPTPEPTPPPTPPPGNGGKCNCVCNCYTCPPIVDQTRNDFWKK